MSIARSIVAYSIACLAVSACSMQEQRKESADEPVLDASTKPITQNTAVVKPPASAPTPSKPPRIPAQKVAPANPAEKKSAADGYPLSPSGKKCPDYAQATVVKKKLSKESSDGYLFDTKFRLTGKVEEIAAWGYNLNATRLKVGDKVCILAGYK